MIKEDYINRIFELGEGKVYKKDIVFTINTLFKLMADDLKNDEKITISNFGSFEVATSKPTNIYSPYDGKLLENVVQRRVHFKSSNYLKEK